MIAELLSRAESILVLAHQKPDGDAIGSMLALHLALTGLGKDVHCAAEDGCPEKYAFLPGADGISAGPPDEDYECAIALDCDGKSRMGGLSAAFDRTNCTINIDHHDSEDEFAQINWCDRSKAAVGVMIRELVPALGVDISPKIAVCLYCAIVTDTGGFRYENTDPEALRVAAELVEIGVDAADIARRTLERMSITQAQLLGRALGSLQTRNDGDLLIAKLSREDFADIGALAEHTDGVVGDLKRVDDARIIVLLKEESPGEWRVSMRSDEVDVSRLCREHGGGGHRTAAGCELTGTAQEVTDRIARDAAALL